MESFTKRFDRRVKAIRRESNIQYQEIIKNLNLRENVKNLSNKGNYHPHKHTIIDTINEAISHPKFYYNQNSTLNF